MKSSVTFLYMRSNKRLPKKISLVMFTMAIAFSVVKAVYFPEGATYNETDVVLTPSGVESHQAFVTRVVDGDTLKIKRVGNASSTEETVRLIGINTPETVDPRTKVECFGKEASAYMKSLVEGKKVVLQNDPTQGAADKYKRLLAYVILPDGTNINKKMIEDGYAFEYTYNIPYKYQTEFNVAENAARSLERGLWNPAACDYSLK